LVGRLGSGTLACTLGDEVTRVFRQQSPHSAPAPIEPVSDTELGIAALMLGVVLVLATLIIPALA
jgi:hypothetical protein